MELKLSSKIFINSSYVLNLVFVHGVLCVFYSILETVNNDLILCLCIFLELVVKLIGNIYFLFVVF